ncbi:hypothetical protein KSS87_021452 [Heliosperma pusillum]|nr:hypothetical protein KSS87_014451 [Heliosperma pusillum]KAH9616097.1 hypothetical protein KSS87_021452 [Heliosperma pusillum]
MIKTIKIEERLRNLMENRRKNGSETELGFVSVCSSVAVAPSLPFLLESSFVSSSSIYFMDSCVLYFILRGSVSFCLVKFLRTYLLACLFLFLLRRSEYDIGPSYIHNTTLVEIRTQFEQVVTK